MAIPKELRRAKRWLVWRGIPIPGKAKPNRVPFYASGKKRYGTLDTPEDTARLATYEQACSVAGSYSGLGFALGDGFAGIDLDGVRNPDTGEIVDWAREVIARAKSYTEVSPSGTGVHILGRIKDDLRPLGSNGSGVEFYPGRHYFTVTGEVLRNGAFADLGPVFALLEQRHGTSGKRLDRTPAPAVTASPSMWQYQKIEAVKMLACIPNDIGREPWRNIGFALHHASGGAEDARDIWHDWSIGARNYDPEDWPTQWESFKEKHEKPITFASLVHLARQHGYDQRPAAQPVADNPAAELTTTFDALDEAKEIEWFVTDLLAPGATALIGPPKIGKGYFILQLLDALENGGTLLAGKAERPAPAIYIAAEDNKNRMARRLKKTGAKLRTTMLITLDMVEAAARRYAATMQAHEYVQHLLDRHPERRVVVIDSAETYRAIWNNEKLDREGRARVTEADYQAARVYDQVGLARAAGILLINHTAKRKTHGGGDFHERSNRTNTYLAGLTTSIVMDLPNEADPFDTEEKRRVFAVRSREFDRESVWLAQFNERSRFDLLGDYREQRQSALMQEIMRAVRDLQTPDKLVSGQMIADAVGVKRSTIANTIMRMMRTGRAVGEIDGERWQLMGQMGPGGGYKVIRVNV